MKIGDKVRFRGKFASEFSIRGTIEALDGASLGQAPIGVRLENNNFEWAEPDQVKYMDPLKYPEFRVTEATKDGSGTSGYYVRCADEEAADAAYRQAFPSTSKSTKLRVERWKEPLA